MTIDQDTIAAVAEGIRSRLIDEHYDDELYALAQSLGIDPEAVTEEQWDSFSDAVWDALVANMKGESE